jgi:hypothetical protein
VYLGYAVMLVGAYFLAERRFDWRRLADTTARVVGLILAVLLLGTVFWPWAQGAPLTRPVEALFGLSSYPWPGGTLFDGHNYSAQDLPWDYAPRWFLISTPPVVLLGAALSAYFSTLTDALRRLALWGIAILPVAAAVVMGSTMYDGIRHFDFVQPILAVLAASGWTALLGRARHSWVRRGAAVVLAAGIASILVFDVRFHPNQGVYFNSLVGGPRGAFARYELDYWGNSVLQAVEWSRNLARTSGAAVTISGNPEHLVQLDAARFPEVAFVRARRGNPYLFIRLARGPVEGVLELEQQPALYQVRTPDGALLCSVVRGPGYAELEDLMSRARSRAASRKAGGR